MLGLVQRRFSAQLAAPPATVLTWLAPHLVGGPQAPHPGRLDHHGFEVPARWLFLKRRITPTIRGRFVPAGDGTRIDVAITPAVLYLVVLALPLPALVLRALLELVVVVAALVAGDGVPIASAIALGAVGAGALFYLGLIWAVVGGESRRAEREVRAMVGLPPR